MALLCNGLGCLSVRLYILSKLRQPNPREGHNLDDFAATTKEKTNKKKVEQLAQGLKEKKHYLHYNPAIPLLGSPRRNENICPICPQTTCKSMCIAVLFKIAQNWSFHCGSAVNNSD